MRETTLPARRRLYLQARLIVASNRSLEEEAASAPGDYAHRHGGS